ncbi:D-arabinono-1,4-lactone oxidase [Nocardioides sp.]|uniref:D-arabinono-1,4-lactone oxidase n=1 Tax=Nocardioides sp. TaxID=35761 RepID=UPI003D0F96E9
MTEWKNWAGLETASPRRTLEPRSTDEIVTAVLAARELGQPVKMIGTGHSFTAISAPEHTMLRPTHLGGIVAVDRTAMTVTALAGTQLKTLNAELERLGLSLHNMGDIAEQTLAGAVSTGTHGTGGVVSGLAAQLAALELVTGTGEVIAASPTENADVFDLARVGLGALGILTTLTFQVEPLFVLEADERPGTWEQTIASYDELVDANHHVDLYWFPHTDRMLIKANNRLDVPLGEAEPLSRWRGWLDDDFLSNTFFGALTRVLNLAPAAIPRANEVAARALTARTYSDTAHRVFVARRTVVFREMEYAVPRAAGMAALREARRVIDASDWKISFPVEIRCAPAEDVALSTAQGQDSVYLAFHVHRDADHEAYFRAVEQVMVEHGGRPHWGKLHTRTAEDLAATYPRFGDFQALRDRLDPDRLFTNPYLRRVLGD